MTLTADLVKAAWKPRPATYRDSDKRGGANGARLRLAPQMSWAAHEPAALRPILAKYEEIQADFNGAQSGDKRVSLADLIVLGGAAAIESAAQAAGHDVTVPFTPGRTDATTEMTDAEGFAPLEPASDGFRNYFSDGSYLRPEAALVDRANQLQLTAPEMTALVGGMRALGATHANSSHGVFTDAPGTLTNDFFVNLLDLGVEWRKAAGQDRAYEGVDRATGDVVWTGTSVDLIFGSNSQLRAIAEVYASADGKDKFVQDFVDAWSKVMMLDRFELDS